MIRIPGWIANLFRSDGSGSPAYTPMTESQFTDTYGYMAWDNRESTRGGKTNNKRPTFADMYLYFPKNNSGCTLPGPKVYERVGGKILQMYKANPSRYQNACALRVSFALNHSGVNIPNVEGTYTGEDGKFYFLSSGKLFSWLESYFGPPDITDISKMPDNIGIYINRALPYPNAKALSGLNRCINSYLERM